MNSEDTLPSRVLPPRKPSWVLPQESTRFVFFDHKREPGAVHIVGTSFLEIPIG